MQRTAIGCTCFTLLAIAGVTFLIDADAETPPAPTAEPDAVPMLRFAGFDEINGVPIARMTLTNTTPRPIYYAGYGPTHPLKTWERRDGNRWVDCGYEWCGTGRSNYRLAPNTSIDFYTGLRDYRTPEMPDDPPLAAYTKPMRVVLYYGHAETDIQHPVVSKPFKAAAQCGG